MGSARLATRVAVGNPPPLGAIVEPPTQALVVSVRALARNALERVESLFDAMFGPALNPLYQLGALGWYLFWIVAVSGLYVYIFFDTGIEDAYASVEYLTHEQWYLGGVMRSLHRYASDALVVVMLLHMAREFILDRYRGARWYPWLLGMFHGSELIADDPAYQARAAALGLPDPRTMSCTG